MKGWMCPRIADFITVHTDDVRWMKNTFKKYEKSSLIKSASHLFLVDLFECKNFHEILYSFSDMRQIKIICDEKSLDYKRQMSDFLIV